MTEQLQRKKKQNRQHSEEVKRIGGELKEIRIQWEKRIYISELLQKE